MYNRINLRWLAPLVAIAFITLVQCSSNNNATNSSGNGNNNTHHDSTYVASHTAPAAFASIPASVIRQVRNDYKIFYGHTSHGSQLLTGMGMIQSEDTIYQVNSGTGSLSITEYADDLGYGGDTTWVAPTRAHLNQQGNTTNIVIWSWCGGVSGNTSADMDVYLNKMNELENDYPNVTFIYMTGHLDGSGPTGALYVNNNKIRTYCSTNNKVLFDFADIESYDPAGNYYANGSDACEWCISWTAEHTAPACVGCAHTDCFNCYQKGKSFWWLLSRLSGWQG
jgi:hypothetical protein